MQFFRGAITKSKTIHGFLTVVLAVGLALSGAGCDSGGSNGGDDDDGDEDAVVPAAPSGLEAESGDAEIMLTWEAATDAETYNVYRDTESGVDVSGDPLEGDLSETSYTDESAENGTTYYYVVTAVADEEGDASGEVEITPFSSPPDRPEN